MLFTQEDLGVINEASAILENSIYIDHSLVSPQTTSVIINEDLNVGIVKFSDIEALSEEYGCDYIDAMVAVAESNEIDPNQLAVAVDEAKIIEDPDIVYELANVVVNPISENSLAYLFCEAMVDAYAESGDEDYLLTLIDEGASAADAVYGPGGIADDDDPATQEAFRKSKPKINTTKAPKSNEARLAAQHANLKGKWYNKLGAKGESLANSVKNSLGNAGEWVKNNKGKTALAGLALAGGAYLANKHMGGNGGKDQAVANAQAVLKQAEGKPKSWISQKIASLRKVYANYMHQAQGPNAGMFKQIAGKILAVIDALMKKLQTATA